MPEVQQIRRLILSQFQQFKLCDFDFTDPATGLPLPRICLTGPNGCGKSTLLAHVYHSIDPSILPLAVEEEREANALILVEYDLGPQTVYLARNAPALGSSVSRFAWFSSDIENAPGWEDFLERSMGFHEFSEQFSAYGVNDDDDLSAPDAATAWLSPSLDLIDSQPVDTLRGMIDSLHEKRSRQFTDFLKRPENREETVSAVEELFAETFPDPVAGIAAAWEPVLAPANIRFSRAAPAGLLSGRTGESIPFSSLSPGLRRYFLRTGHLRIQRMERKFDHSFFVLDEPESGLGSELAAALVADCLAGAQGKRAQIFLATLSPALVETFADHEIFRLRFDETNGIRVERDTPAPIVEIEPHPQSPSTPEAARPTPRPNAIRLARLKREIRESEDQEEIADLIDELMSIRDR